MHNLVELRPFLANLISQKLKLKNHWAVADYLQRSARHISSRVDLDHAEAVGRHAVKYAVKGMNGVMPVIKKKKDFEIFLGNSSCETLLK